MLLSATQQRLLYRQAEATAVIPEPGVDETQQLRVMITDESKLDQVIGSKNHTSDKAVQHKTPKSKAVCFAGSTQETQV